MKYTKTHHKHAFYNDDIDYSSNYRYLLLIADLPKSLRIFCFKLTLNLKPIRLTYGEPGALVASIIRNFLMPLFHVLSSLPMINWSFWRQQPLRQRTTTCTSVRNKEGFFFKIFSWKKVHSVPAPPCATSNCQFLSTTSMNLRKYNCVGLCGCRTFRTEFCLCKPSR